MEFDAICFASLPMIWTTRIRPRATLWSSADRSPGRLLRATMFGLGPPIGHLRVQLADQDQRPRRASGSSIPPWKAPCIRKFPTLSSSPPASNLWRKLEISCCPSNSSTTHGDMATTSRATSRCLSTGLCRAGTISSRTGRLDFERPGGRAADPDLSDQETTGLKTGPTLCREAAPPSSAGTPVAKYPKPTQAAIGRCAFGGRVLPRTLARG